MPVYVYKNLATGETFELAQRITEPALTTHPETGDPVKRLVQPVGITFRGSGFYVTDSRQNGENGRAQSKGSDDKNKGEGAKDSKEKGSAAKSEASAASASD